MTTFIKLLLLIRTDPPIDNLSVLYHDHPDMKSPMDQDKSANPFDLFVRQARPIKDTECLKVVGNISGDYILSVLDLESNILDFESSFFQWVGPSQWVQFQKDSRFSVAMCNGITEAFHHFFLTFPQKNLVVLPGEYPYHRDYYDSLQKPLQKYVAGSLSSDHCVVLSVPFSATGDIHPETTTLLKECSEKNVPVFLDLAFVGLGCPLNINEYLSYDCVHSFAFSFSKLFALGKFRIGLYWSKQAQGPLFITRKWNYSNWVGAAFARKLMQKIHFDYIHLKYRPLQHQLCEKFQLTPSASVIFGLDNERYPKFHREKTINRLCLSQALEVSSHTQEAPWN